MAMVRRFSRDVQQNGSETLTCQNTVTDRHLNRSSTLFTDGEYKNIYGGIGCVNDLNEPPPSAENKICKKFQEKIKQLKENWKRKDLNDDFVKAFLESNPTESVLIPTEEIRFGRFFNQPRFQGRSRSR